MITAYQLAQRVNTAYPNSGFEYQDTEVESTDTLQRGMIDYINSALARVSKYIMLDNIYEFPMIAGQRLYELPLDCEFGNIMEVTREFGKLVKRCDFGREDDLIGGCRYFNGYGNTIALTPMPCIDGDKITIYYKHTPVMIQTGDDPIEVKDKYIDLLVYSICSDMASSGSNPDIEVANNFTMKYNNLYQEAFLDKYKEQPYYPRTRDNKRPPLSLLRRG